MVASEQKQPLHARISFRLAVAICGSNNPNAGWSKAPIVRELLYILKESDMPAAAAHQVAREMEHLPGAMRTANEPDLVKLAEEVHADLAGRKDQPKKEAAPAST